MTAVDVLPLVVVRPAPTAFGLLLIGFAMADALRVTSSSFSPLTSEDSSEILRLILAARSADSVARVDSVCTTPTSECSIPREGTKQFHLGFA